MEAPSGLCGVCLSRAAEMRAASEMTMTTGDGAKGGTRREGGSSRRRERSCACVFSYVEER